MWTFVVTAWTWAKAFLATVNLGNKVTGIFHDASVFGAGQSAQSNLDHAAVDTSLATGRIIEADVAKQQESAIDAELRS